MNNQTYIRSYVRREGRMTSRQKRGLSSLVYQTDRGAQDYLSGIHKNQPIICEVGFGMGDWLLQQAVNYPEQYYIGIDVYRPGIGSALASISEQDLHNVRIICGDAQLFFTQLNQPTFSDIVILFPDPWPKNRQQKRRLIHLNFLLLAITVLKTDGYIWMVTDDPLYAMQMHQVLGQTSLVRCSDQQRMDSINTKYAKKAVNRARYSFLYQKRDIRT